MTKVLLQRKISQVVCFQETAHPTWAHLGLMPVWAGVCVSHCSEVIAESAEAKDLRSRKVRNFYLVKIRGQIFDFKNKSYGGTVFIIFPHLYSDVSSTFVVFSANNCSLWRQWGSSLVIYQWVLRTTRKWGITTKEEENQGTEQKEEAKRTGGI